MPVPILKQGDTLIAIDVTEVDVLDSFATRTLRGIAYTAKLLAAKREEHL